MAGNSTTDISTWLTDSTAELLETQNADGGWPYYKGQGSSTEATALAMLALSESDSATVAVASAADWLGQRQQSDGMFTASASHAEGSWLTPLAAMAMARQGYQASASSASAALLGVEVFTFVPPVSGLYGYDTLIPGWPWTIGDFSWVEPTSLATIFLKQEGQGASDRVRRAVDLLRNRFISSGGWNYGEPVVLNGQLFPTVAPTALASLALADEPGEQEAVGLSWLMGQRGGISSLFSLGWATLALNIMGSLDDDWRTDVIARWTELPTDRRGPMGTSLCLLGLSDTSAHPFALS